MKPEPWQQLDKLFHAALAKSGQCDEAVKLRDELILESTRRDVSNYSIAIVYIGLNEKENALVWLEKVIAEHSPSASYFAVIPELDDLRGDPRFKDMLKRLNLPE